MAKDTDKCYNTFMKNPINIIHEKDMDILSGILTTFMLPIYYIKKIFLKN